MAMPTSNCTNGTRTPPQDLPPETSLLPWMSDVTLSLILPIVSYWGFSLIFEAFEYSGMKYRSNPLHSTAEKITRTHITKRKVFFGVVQNMALQFVIAWGLSRLIEEAPRQDDEYAISSLALTIRNSQKWVPKVLGIVGIDSKKLALNIALFMPSVASIMAGGITSLPKNSANITMQCVSLPLMTWEVYSAKIVYYFMLPVFKLAVALMVADTWQYFAHRLLHEWKWLYRNTHSKHHSIYVPWSWSAFYTHPFDTLILDTIPVAIVTPLIGLTTRENMLLVMLETFSSLSDHAGFEIAFNPLTKYVRSVDFHDLHHQNWGIKHNYGSYTAFWDWLFGTLWVDMEVCKQKYARSMEIAEEKLR